MKIEVPKGAAEAAAARFAAAAAEAGLVEVAYAVEPSPLGDLVLASTERGLIRVAYGGDESLERVLEELAGKVSPRVLEAPGRLDAVRRELDEYFAGERTSFDVPVDWRLSQGFGRKVLRATARIPYGRVLTYKEVAAKAGSPRGSRAAGNALGANRMPIVIPCHRVLHSGGGLGGYTGGLDKKEHLLRLEGALAG